jgi:hypothetical protein
LAVAEFTVAQASLAITPSFSGLADAIREQATSWGDQAGDAFQEAFDAVVGSLGPSDADEAKKGSSAGGSFADAFKARVDAALAALPKVDINADTSETDAKIAAIRSELETLSGQTVGIDISDADALAKLTVLKGALVDINHSSESVKVKVDTGSALTELEAIGAAAGDGPGGAGSGLSSLGGEAESAGSAVSEIAVPAMLALGVALIPLGGLALGGLSALPTIFAGLGVGAGVIALAAPAIEALAKTTFDPLVKSLRPLIDDAIMPGIAAAMKSIVPLFEDLAPILVPIAAGIGSLAQQFGAFLGSAPALGQINTLVTVGASFMQQMGQDALTLFEAFTGAGAQAANIIVPALASGITHLVDSLSHWITDGGFNGFLIWLQKNGPAIVSDVGDLLKGVGKLVVAFAPAGVALDNIAGALGNIISALSPVIGALEKLQAFTDQYLTKALLGLANGIDYLDTHWQQLATDLEHYADVAWQAVDTDFVQPFLNFFEVTIPNDLSDVVGFFKALPGNIVTALGDVVTTIWAPIASAAGWVNTNVIVPVVGDFAALPGNIVKALGDVGTSIWTGLTSAAGWVNTNVIVPVVGFFSKLPGDIVTGLGDIVSTVFSGFSSAWTWIKKNVYDPIVSGFGNLPTDIGTAIGNAIGGLGNIGKEIIHYLVEGVNDAINWYDSHRPSLFGISLLPSIPDFNVPALASGGPVSAGNPYLVGEVGPELFVPKTTGYVIPNSHLQQIGQLTSAGSGSSPAGALQHINTQIIQSQADAAGMAMQLAFLQKARRL